MIDVVYGRDASLTRLVFNNAKTLKKNFWLDVDFFQIVYESKIQELEVGKNIKIGEASPEKIDDKEAIRKRILYQELNRISKSQKKLSKDIRILFGKISTSEAIDFSSFPALIESIEERKHYCEEKFQMLIEKFPSRLTYDRYAKFLSEYSTESQNIEIILREGRRFGESQEGETMSDSGSISSESSGSEVKKNSQEKIKAKVDGAKTVETGGTKVSEISTDTNLTLRNAVLETRYCSVFSLRVFLFFLLLAVTTVGIVMFIFGIIAKSDFDSGSTAMDKGARINFRASSVAHALRKIQLSNSKTTPIFGFEEENDSAEWYSRANTFLSELKSYFFFLYKDFYVDAWVESFSFRATRLTEYNYSDTSHQNQNNDPTYPRIDLTLFDSLQNFIRGAEGILSHSIEELKNETWWEENEDYQFIRNNEDILDSSLIIVKNQVFKKINDRDYKNMLVLVLLPFALVLFLFTFLPIFISLLIQQRQSMKGLFLIPQQKAVSMFVRFGGFSDNLANFESKKRDSSSKLNLLLRVFLIFSAVIILSFVILFISSILAIVFQEKVKIRNSIYLYLPDTGTRIRRCHYYSTDLIYDYHRYLNQSSLQSVLKDQNQHLMTDDTAFRFGLAAGTMNIDYFLNLYSKYYGTVCSDGIMNITTFDDPSISLNDYFRCQSYSNLVISFESSVDTISKATDFERSSVEKDSSLLSAYHKILAIDGGINNTKPIINRLLSIFSSAGEFGSIEMEVLLNYVYAILFIFLPVFFFIFVFILLPLPGKIENNFVIPKKLMLLLDKETLLSPSIYSFIKGIHNFNKLFSNAKQMSLTGYYRVMKHQNYSIILFDKFFNVLYANDACKELFAVMDPIHLSALFPQASLDSLKNLIASSISNRETKAKIPQTQVAAMCSGVEFNVLVDVSFDGDLYMGIIENIDSSKKKEILRETESQSKETENLLKNIFPEQLLPLFKDFVKNGIFVKSDKALYMNVHKSASCIFCDIVNFTSLSLSMNPLNLVQILHEIFSGIDEIAKKFNVLKIKTIGDSWMGVVGIPTYHPLHALSCVNFGLEVLQFIKLYSKLIGNDKIGFRIGISSGQIIAAIIGHSRLSFDVWSSTINQAARLEANGLAGKLLVSRDTYAFIFKDLSDKVDFMEKNLQIQGIGVIPAYVVTPLDDDGAIQNQINFLNERSKETGQNPLSIFLNSLGTDLLKKQTVESQKTEGKKQKMNNEGKKEQELENVVFETVVTTDQKEDNIVKNITEPKKPDLVSPEKEKEAIVQQNDNHALGVSYKETINQSISSNNMSDKSDSIEFLKN